MSETIINPAQHLEKAYDLHQTGQLGKATQLYQEIIQAAPETIEAYINLTHALSGLGKGHEAILFLQKGLEAAPNHPELLYTISNTLTNSGDIANGFQYAKSGVEHHPDNAQMQYIYANICLFNNMVDEGFAAYHKAIEIQPDHAEAHYNLGNLLFNLNRKQEAAHSFEQAILHAPDLIPAYLSLGSILTEYGQYNEAIGIYQKALAEDAEYGLIYKCLGMAQHVSGNVDGALKSYETALSKGAQDAEVYTLLGNATRDLGQEQASIKYYEKALTFDPNNPVAQQNIKRIRSKRISSWHIEMLADTARNNAYDQALKNNIQSHHHVLDIGTGSGLLAMMAARAGAQSVTACEMVPELAQIATKIVANNQLDQQISVHHKKSTSLIVGQDLPQKADFVVSEILDVGLLGEGVIPSLRHATQNLLKEDAIIIPQAAQIQGVLIESDHVSSVSPIQQVSGFDLSAFNEYRMTGEYQRIHLKTLPHEKLTEIYPLLNFDFYNLPAPTSAEQPNVFRSKIPIKKSGKIHGIVFWFNLNLDATTSVSSGPDGEMIHWGQALYSFEKELEVTEKEEILLEMRQSDMLLQFDVFKLTQ